MILDDNEKLKKEKGYVRCYECDNVVANDE